MAPTRAGNAGSTLNAELHLSTAIPGGARHRCRHFPCYFAASISAALSVALWS